ncbi:MAG: AMP-binding protein, partial [bacterium]
KYAASSKIIYRKDVTLPALLVDTFLLSCRVIGKNVERVILNRLIEIAKQNNLTSITIPFIPTERNKPAEYFIKSIISVRRTNDCKESLHLYSLDINQDTQINYYMPAIKKAESFGKTRETKQDNSYNAAIIDIAKNHEVYLSNSYQHDDFEQELLNMLNRICRKKIPSIDAGFVSSGVDSFELMMFLAQIYRRYMVKIDMLEMQKIDNINICTIAEIIQKNSTTTDTYSKNNMLLPSLLPLSAAQKALWLERLKTQNDTPYNLFRVFYIKGKLNIPKLESAFKLVIAKHECLRMAFLTQENSMWPVCKVFPLETLDFKLQIEKKEIANLNDISFIVHSLVQKPFNLERPPAIRANLIIISHDECYLLITMHHIICDGWSFSRFVNEATLAYNGKDSEPSLPYSRFVEWQQEQAPIINNINPELVRKHFLNYPVMNLPYDFNKPKISSYKGQHISFEFNQELTGELHKISSQCNTTLYETMLSIYMVFLAKLCNQTDASLASVISTRPQEYFDTIGYMVNLITLRSDLSSNPNFLDFLAQTKLSFQVDRKIGDVPFLEVVKKYRECFKDIDSLTKVLFVFENFPSYELSLNDTQTQEIYCGNYLTLSLPNTSKFDLAFYFKEKESAEGSVVSGVVEFSNDIFKLETIETFIEMFEQLTKKIVKNINTSVLNHSLLTDREKSTMASWNLDAKKDFPKNSTVLELFLDQVHQYPHKIALIEEDGQKITYSELNAASNKRAIYLQGVGVNKGDVVAVSLERSIEMIAILLAIAKLGAVYLAIDPTYPLERRKYICENAAVKLCIDQSLEISQIKENMDVINKSTKITDVFYIVYTSGSTGKPKGIPTTNLAFCNLLHWFCQCYSFSSSTNTALVASEGFDAFGWQVWPYLACGATINIVHKETFLNTEKFIELINKNSVSICFIPTAYTEILINGGYLDKFKTLEYLLTGGDKLNAFLPKRYPFKIINHYGVSESAVVSTFCEIPFFEKNTLEKLPYDRPLIGKPINNTEIYILDSNKQQVPIGVWGELCIGGIGVADGYIGDSYTSTHKFIKNNFTLHVDSKLYLTGDVARFLHDGSVEYLNRLDNQIEIDGYRIEPAEIEMAILKDIRIDQAVALLHGDNGLSKQLVAYATLKDSTNDFVNISEVIDSLKKQLPLKMVPKHIVVLDKFPITENGKVDRACLAKKDIFMQKSKTFLNTNNKLYVDILNMFSKLLNESPEKIDTTKSFFELGGDSITILKLLNTIKKDFGVNISVSEVYKNSSVAYFASCIAKHQPQNTIMMPCDTRNINNSLVTLRNGNSDENPLFFMHPVGGAVFCYQEIVNHLNKNQTCYGIQYPSDSNNIGSLPKNIQELASYYISFIKLTQPKGPYAIVGHSFGGMLAYEIAYQLYNAGENISLVAVLDTWVVNMLDKQKKQKLKRDIIQKYQDQYESIFTEDAMAETRFIHMQNIGFVYKPPKFEGTINLFKANIQLPELVDIQNDTNFWSEFTNVNIHCVNGDHDSILETNNAKYLADKLTNILQGITYERRQS